MSEFKKQDAELAAMMGDKFVDQTVPLSEQADNEAAEAKRREEAFRQKKAAQEAKDAQWIPTKQPKNEMDRLKGFAKDCMLYGTVSAILFCWQQTGKLDYTTAWYALLVSVGMVFFSVGKHWWRKQ